MPEENNQDANTTVSSSDPDGLLSSPDGSAAPIPTGDQNGDDAGKTAAKENGAAGAADGAGDKQGETDDTRYDQLPRFQELNAKVKAEKEARVAAEAKLALLEKSPLNPEWIPASTEQKDFTDTSKMSSEEIREWQEDDPAGFAANLRKEAAWEARQAIKAESLRNDTVSQIEQTFNQYAKDNPTFNEMWESGEIERFMNDHPGHNAISAHMAMTAGKLSGDVKAQIDAAVAKAVKETEERVRKDFLAKRGATVISSTSAARSADNGVDTALKDTNQFGGTNAVLAQRLAEMRRRAAGG